MSTEEELGAIKNLLLLLLVKLGTTQQELSRALKVDQSTISRICSTKGIKKFGFIQTK